MHMANNIYAKSRVLYILVKLNVTFWILFTNILYQGITYKFIRSRQMLINIHVDIYTFLLKS
jgi:hypothetical protein